MAQLSVRTPNEDGESVTRTFHIEDEHAEEEASQLEALSSQAEQVPELQEERDELGSENETFREALVSEIVRRKKLSGELDEDGVEEEREFLLGLPAGRLKKHYDRALELEVDTEAALDPGKEPGESASEGGNIYEEKGL